MRFGDSIMLDLRWRPRAHLDRESIAIYLGVEQHSPQAALDTIKRIDDAILFAREFPDAGGRYRRDELQHEYRTVLANPYAIYYRFDDEALTVYRILHQHQDLDTYVLASLEG